MYGHCDARKCWAEWIIPKLIDKIFQKYPMNKWLKYSVTQHLPSSKETTYQQSWTVLSDDEKKMAIFPAKWRANEQQGGGWAPTK